MSIAGTHIYKREKTQANTRKNARSIPRRVTYKEGPQVRANGGTKANAPRDLDLGPQIRLPEEDKDERRPSGAARPPRSAEPGRPPVQVHFDVACPLLLLITFHIFFWQEPTLKTIKGGSLHLSHTHHFICEGEE